MKRRPARMPCCWEAARLRMRAAHSAAMPCIALPTHRRGPGSWAAERAPAAHGAAAAGHGAAAAPPPGAG